MARSLAVLTGDLVQSSALTARQLDRAMAALEAAAATIDTWPGAETSCFTRRGGDGWQVVLTRTDRALRAALLFQAALLCKDASWRTRVVIGTGTGSIPRSGDLNRAHGSAFLASGRGLDALPKSVRLLHTGGGALGAATRLADHISRGWTRAQARSVLHMLVPEPPTRAYIAKRLKITRQAVDQALESAGFQALTQALELIETPPGEGK